MLFAKRSQDEEQNEIYIEQVHEIAAHQLKTQARETPDTKNVQIVTPFQQTILVDYAHILSFHEDLADALSVEFTRLEPFLRRAAKTFVHEHHPELIKNETAKDYPYFCAIYNFPELLPVRDLKMGRVGTLTAVTGTVTRSTEVRPELLSGSFTCTKCGLMAADIPQHFHFTRPTICRNPRCRNTSTSEFLLDTPQSEFTNWQKLRVQENSDEIPPGSMPRSMDIILRNEMVERVKAGDKCIFTGSLVVIPDGSALARAGDLSTASKAVRPSELQRSAGNGIRGLKALGVRELTYRTCFVACTVVPVTNTASLTIQQMFSSTNAQDNDQTAEQVACEFTQEEILDIRAMKSTPRLYEKLVESLCPSTFGHKEVKRGILLQLLSGVHKKTPEGISLRGDINVCIVGDPSTAKSQFLKYVHEFASRSVYTSGKASSAAGLTAAVQRDQDTGEYCIEAGALMLADNGICCIDEFDKVSTLAT